MAVIDNLLVSCQNAKRSVLLVGRGHHPPFSRVLSLDFFFGSAFSMRMCSLCKGPEKNEQQVSVFHLCVFWIGRC